MTGYNHAGDEIAAVVPMADDNSFVPPKEFGGVVLERTSPRVVMVERAEAP